MLSCIWDLDGTLLDSYPVIVAAAKKAAEDAGVQDPETKVLQAVKQGSLFEYLNDVASHGSLPFWELREKYRCYTHEMDDTIPLMEGAPETLDLLKQNIVWIITRMEVEMSRYPMLGETVTVETFPTPARRRYRACSRN